ncbi:rho GTPase-activating protein conundrum isoform X2 [Drosophila bipectinata]|uniref:rho GTPase-activating protein conundrum isoform X2 n=1 Tax=Drosophila bipectinata TaxID=42026 RepID=UPI001C8AFBDA|nr:rho GTPase-activating protein conundrum isoform X2 [Drosophila bipectinata]
MQRSAMENKSSLDHSSDLDYSEFLNEYFLQNITQCQEPEVTYDDGELEAEWLVSIGYPELTKPFEKGLEVHKAELEPVLKTLSKPHAEAIRQRVIILNQTVRGRKKIRSKRKPDIRDLFRDFDESSTGTRSRSATPDSLDSIQVDDVWGTSSIKARGETAKIHSENNTSGDSSDDCIDKLNENYKQLSKSDNECPGNLLMAGDVISFENICRDTFGPDEVDILDDFNPSQKQYIDIVLLSEIDIKRLQSIIWLELATIFDRNKISLDRRKPYKRRRKEEGNLFGVSLSALIRRDQQITGTDSNLVPLFLENLLAEITLRGSTEEGILRIAGNKQKTEVLYNELESIFYLKFENMDNYFSNATVHELSALLKRWLRELPQPLLTNELVQLFYQCHKLTSMDQKKAFSLLCQLLPHENRNTFRALLSFLNNIINLQNVNKMNLHNVSTIIAPSFFPPRNVHPVNKNNIEEQVKMAAICCRLTNVLITRGEKLFQVQKNLITESKSKKRMRKKALSQLEIMEIRNGNPTSSTIINEESKNTNHVHHTVV